MYDLVKPSDSVIVDLSASSPRNHFLLFCNCTCRIEVSQYYVFLILEKNPLVKTSVAVLAETLLRPPQKLSI